MHHHYLDESLMGSRSRQRRSTSALADDQLSASAKGEAEIVLPTNPIVPEKGGSKSCGPIRSKRDRNQIRLAMQKAAGVDHNSELGPTPGDTGSLGDHGDIGLTQRDLEDRRWNVSPVIAKERLMSVGLPYQGRRANLIYSWASIFRAEGIAADIAKKITKIKFPGLYEDLIDTSAAAELLGFRDASSVRKLVGSGDIPKAAYITFGARGIYRFRLGALMAVRKASSVGLVV